MVWVTNLQQAIDAYWLAQSRRDEQAAYHEILLFGGKDGYPHGPRWRIVIVRTLRRIAAYLDGDR